MQELPVHSVVFAQVGSLAAQAATFSVG